MTPEDRLCNRTLGPALREAITARVPTVLDVRTSLKVSFADITSPLAVEASPRRR
ncbi:MAG TPA: hypothetical protein VGL95_19420 [Acetobacteraceae bacterium]|jgi:acetolactate synthase-1/2/3 large subunit